MEDAHSTGASSPHTTILEEKGRQWFQPSTLGNGAISGYWFLHK
jgi:hypothetical protein